MRIIRSLAVSAGTSLLLILGSAGFVAAEQTNPQTAGLDAKAQLGVAQVTDCKRQSAANGAGQDIFLSTATPRTYANASGAWQDVDCTGTTFRIANGARALVVSNFNAEADCNGSSPTNGQWCQTRALLNGAEGAPVAAEPSSFAFDSVAGGSQNWQAHSMARAWEVRCGTEGGCQYKFTVQTRMHDASVTGMWIDEVATQLHVTYGAPAAL